MSNVEQRPITLNDRVIDAVDDQQNYRYRWQTGPHRLNGVPGIY
ncbi:hypothetical protein [Pseudomonas fluorescens]|nr:hypothetical protein [Pseudomonas fluorescens]